MTAAEANAAEGQGTAILLRGASLGLWPGSGFWATRISSRADVRGPAKFRRTLQCGATSLLPKFLLGTRYQRDPVPRPDASLIPRIRSISPLCRPPR